jgi:hypothetical protein
LSGPNAAVWISSARTWRKVDAYVYLEALEKLTLRQLKTLRENAFTRKAAEIVALCDAECVRRKPAKTTRPKGDGVRATRGPVQGFHFICPRELDVISNGDGKFWTGIWAVSEAHLAPALAVGAYVALHSSKAELSHRQVCSKAGAERRVLARPSPTALYSWRSRVALPSLGAVMVQARRVTGTAKSRWEIEPLL